MDKISQQQLDLFEALEEENEESQLEFGEEGKVYEEKEIEE